jgi:H+-transporting ATPase
MSGDGVNDAPALRQAEAGIAVANATDVAKAAAAMVLTRPGLGGVVPAIEASRLVFQRIITYTLNMLIKKIEIMALLVIGFLVTHHKPLTPLLMVLFLFLNDFLTMSLSTDRMQYSRRPNRWNTRGILLAATALAACKLVFSLGIFLGGYHVLHLDMPHLQTLMFATVILSSQAGVYLLRERGHFWQSQPSRFLVGSSLLGLGVALILALGGILMQALSASFFLGVAGAGIVYFTCLDWLKVWLFGRLNLR